MEGIVLSQLKWPSLAQDLAVMMVPGSPVTDLSMIYRTYNLKEDELKGILQVPKFQAMFQDALAGFKAQGNKAGSIYRALTLSHSLAEKLYKDAMSTMEPKDAIRLLELLMKSSGMLEKEAMAQVNTQVNVNVPLPLPKGLKNKKLAHIDVKPVEA